MDAPALTIDEDHDKINAEDFIQKLTELMEDREDEEGSLTRLKELVDLAWQQESLTIEPLQMEASSMKSAGVKRIAGTQRLSAPPGAKKISEIDIIPLTKTSVKKQKKIVPVIDDAIGNTTDQACKVCKNVSMAGNMVLLCNGCNEPCHMRCNQPPISSEEASNAKFSFFCTNCMDVNNVRKSSSRSASPMDIEKKIKKIKKA